MGQNLILNMNDHGFVVCAYNRTTDKVDHFLANEAKGTKVIGAHSLEEMVSKLKKPRKVMMLVKGIEAVLHFSLSLPFFLFFSLSFSSFFLFSSLPPSESAFLVPTINR